MPYVNIKITREGVTTDQKAELISGVTDLLVRVLDNPLQQPLSSSTKLRLRIGGSEVYLSNSIAAKRQGEQHGHQYISL